jgi:hypothetical protein
MIRLNSMFIPILRSIRVGDDERLDPKLRGIVDGGFNIVNDCVLLAEQTGTTNATLDSFQDKTGFECFINHMHIDDFVSKDVEENSIVFVSKMLEKWNLKNNGGILNSIVSFDKTGGASVRFHYKRRGESWLSDDLDGYQEAIFEMASSDIAFFDLFSKLR